MEANGLNAAATTATMPDTLTAREEFDAYLWGASVGLPTKVIHSLREFGAAIEAEAVAAYLASPEFEERLARALAPMLPQHPEGHGGYPHQSSHRTWTVYDWMTPIALAAAIVKAL